MTLDDVAQVAADLPGAVEQSGERGRSWAVGKKTFAWERPFSKADIKRFAGAPIPEGPVLAVRTEDLHEKQAVLESDLGGVFTIPHFDGYAAVLTDLSVAAAPDVRELVIGGWLSSVPDQVAAEWLAAHGEG